MAEALADRVAALVRPAVEAAGATVYDVEHASGVLRVVVDRPGGIDLDTLAELTRVVSRLLDQEDPLSSRYTLEVSSPGLERRLRTPDHFAGAVGETVRCKLVPGAAERRIEGVLSAAGPDGVVIDGQDVPYAAIQQARTVFEWDAAPRPNREKKAAS